MLGGVSAAGGRAALFLAGMIRDEAQRPRAGRGTAALAVPVPGGAPASPHRPPKGQEGGGSSPGPCVTPPLYPAAGRRIQRVRAHGRSFVISDLIWACVTLALGLAVIFLLGVPVRRALRAWADSLVATASERDAALQEVLVSVAERRHALALREALLDDETASERARFQADTALHETRLKAAAEVLDEAIDANRKVIAARAEAEAALAPEAARNALEASGQAWLAEAYDAYCRSCDDADPLSFGRWIQGYRPR